MTAKPISIRWELGRDRYGRRAVLTKEGDDFSIQIEPSSQRDDGENIRSLTGQMLIDAGVIAQSVTRG